MNDVERYVRYINFLLDNGANPEIVYMPAIDNLILNIIKRGDPIVKAEGRSPIAYLKPNEDGTFDIGGRTAGPIINEKYEMSYCKDDNPSYFIKLVKKEKQLSYHTIDFPFGEPYDLEVVNTIYINEEGKMIKEETDTHLPSEEEPEKTK